ncbi:hypothetical protein M9H77_05396 [Catharanthus roseus]|uniref:Uncharacterized protein n=1 Tax=Catharanthus roseus TaxID=4058 RepID=A0ACC0CH84_CATRO|nr:hypothetical protein M9H77_05396 [Catharanthus roseus]
MKVGTLESCWHMICKYTSIYHTHKERFPISKQACICSLEPMLRFSWGSSWGEKPRSQAYGNVEKMLSMFSQSVHASGAPPNSNCSNQYSTKGYTTFQITLDREQHYAQYCVPA